MISGKDFSDSHPAVVQALRARDEFDARNPEFAAFLDAGKGPDGEDFATALRTHPEAVVAEWESLLQAYVEARVQAGRDWHAGHDTPYRLCYACRSAEVASKGAGA